MELARLVNHIRQSVEFSNHSIPIKRKSPDAANHKAKNGYHSTPLQKFMLPSDIESLCGEEADDNFKNLVGETLDILDSDDCQNVLKMCLDAGFAHVMHNMIPFFQVEELGEFIIIISQECIGYEMADADKLCSTQLAVTNSYSDNKHEWSNCFIKDALIIKKTKIK